MGILHSVSHKFDKTVCAYTISLSDVKESTQSSHRFTFQEQYSIIHHINLGDKQTYLSGPKDTTTTIGIDKKTCLNRKP